MLHSLFNLGALDFGDVGHPKTFATKGGDYAAVNHGPAEITFDGTFGIRQVTHHPAHESVSGAGWVYDRRERIGGGDEDALRTGQDRAMFAFFDDDVFGAEFVNGLGGVE